MATKLFASLSVIGSNVNNANDNKWSVKPTLVATAPQFPYTSVSYTWIRVDSAGAETVLDTNSANTYTPPKAFGVDATSKPPVDPPSYRVRVTVTPTGGTARSVVSVTVTVPSTVSTNGTFSFPGGVW